MNFVAAFLDVVFKASWGETDVEAAVGKPIIDMGIGICCAFSGLCCAVSVSPFCCAFLDIGLREIFIMNWLGDGVASLCMVTGSLFCVTMDVPGPVCDVWGPASGFMSGSAIVPGLGMNVLLGLGLLVMPVFNNSAIPQLFLSHH